MKERQIAIKFGTNVAIRRVYFIMLSRVKKDYFGKVVQYLLRDLNAYIGRI
jgi:hypothetical protein